MKQLLFSKDAFDIAKFDEAYDKCPIVSTKAIWIEPPTMTKPRLAGVQPQEFITIRFVALSEKDESNHYRGTKSGEFNKAIFNVPAYGALYKLCLDLLEQASKVDSIATKSQIFGKLIRDNVKIFEFKSFRKYNPVDRTTGNPFKDVRAGTDSITNRHTFFLLDGESPGGILQAKTRSIDRWLDDISSDDNVHTGVDADTAADVEKELGLEGGTTKTTGK